MTEISGGLVASGRPVIDKTGITEKFDFHIEYAREGAELSDEPGPPAIFAALGQLGQKLEPAEGPGEFLVIERVEKPCYCPTKIITPLAVFTPPTDACTATAPAGAACGI